MYSFLTLSYFQPYLQLPRLQAGPDGDPPQGRGRDLARLAPEAGGGATHGGVGPHQRDAHTEGCLI